MQTYYVYIMTNKKDGVLYTGVTNDLIRRVEQHQKHVDRKSFTTRYDLNRLVYFEETSNPKDAIAREKQIKGGSRAKKVALIESMNPQWRDLSTLWV